MSHRYDSSLIAGAHVYGVGSLGVIGSAIPSTGDNGAGYAYNDLSLPADNAKEICGRITSWPASGTLTAYEDTSFEFTASDGAYSFQYQLYVDGVATGSPETVSLYVGSAPVTIAGNIGTASAYGLASSVASAATISAALGTATASGFAASISLGNEVVISCTTADAVASGYTAEISTAFNLAAKLGIAAASGKTAVITSIGQYVSAPAGSGPIVMSASTIRPKNASTTRPLSTNTTRH